MNLASFTCDPCDNTCQACSGPSSSECTSCDTLNSHRFFVETTGECQSCSEESPGLFFDESSLSCREICGDGLNAGILECDDGNSINGDGCSSTCTIEEDYECEGGSSSSPDTCKSTVGPLCEFSHLETLTSSLRLAVTCEKEVILSGMSED